MSTLIASAVIETSNLPMAFRLETSGLDQNIELHYAVGTTKNEAERFIETHRAPRRGVLDFPNLTHVMIDILRDAKALDDVTTTRLNPFMDRAREFFEDRDRELVRFVEHSMRLDVVMKAIELVDAHLNLQMLQGRRDPGLGMVDASLTAKDFAQLERRSILSEFCMTSIMREALERTGKFDLTFRPAYTDQSQMQSVPAAWTITRKN